MNENVLAAQYNDLINNVCGHFKKSEMLKIRDLSIFKLIGDLSLVIACDSNASNGEKINDTHKNTYNETAVSVLKVPLMEVVAIGAKPIVIVNNLCVEMEPSGKKIIAAMKQELINCGLWDEVLFTGSTEDNMKTLQTGIGVTVIGLLDERNSKIGKTQSGDIVCCVGLPQSGIDVPYSEKDDNVCNIETVIKLKHLSFVNEILPIGSKGALYEANELASVSNLIFHASKTQSIDLETSAGSSTACLVSLKKQNVEKLIKACSRPVYVIGEVK